jgi:hypothetical protein
MVLEHAPPVRVLRVTAPYDPRTPRWRADGAVSACPGARRAVCEDQCTPRHHVPDVEAACIRLTFGRSVAAACVRTAVVGLQVSHGSCLSCSSAAEVQRITSAAWESHTGETARPRASAVLSSRQWLSGGRAGLRAAITPPSTVSRQHRMHLRPGSRLGIVNLMQKIVRLCSKERTIDGFVLARPPVFSPLTHLQIASRERRLVAIFNKLTMPSA